MIIHSVFSIISYCCALAPQTSSYMSIWSVPEGLPLEGQSYIINYIHFKKYSFMFEIINCVEILKVYKESICNKILFLSSHSLA